jgi:monoamine oxidase
MSEITQPTASSESIPDVDIAVVGAGVAGCYTAWRLQTLAKEQLAAGSLLLPLFDGKDRLKVALFEYSDRIGGRLWSVALNGIPEEFAEFGGMRFYKQMHIVWNLIEKLGLASRAIPFPVGEPQNVVYVRGQHLRKRDLAAHHALPYKLRYLEEGKSADELIDFVCETAIEGFSKLRKDYAAAFDAQDWETVRQIRDQYEARKGQAKIGDRTVYGMSWWELQTFLLSNEAFSFILTTSGYDVTNTNGNAAHSIDQLFYGPNSWDFYRLSRGFEELPDRLHEEFHKQGGLTYLLHRLLRFDKVDPNAEGGPYDLLLHKRLDAQDSFSEATAEALTRRGDQGTHVKAKMMVLAMPLRSLQLLEQDTFFFRPSPRNGVNRQRKFDTAMNSVLNVQAFKLFLTYHQPWWEATGVSKGQAVTDLPVRQCYYWASAAPRSGDGNRNAALMATYNNGVAVPYWQSLQNGSPLAPVEVKSMAGDPFHGRGFAQFNRVAQRLRALAPDQVAATLPTPLTLRTATPAMMERAHAQLMEMHGVKYAPAPYDAHFQDWNVDPYGGGWHQWITGANVTEITPYVQQPMQEEQVFIVGECWSDAQGWVQGALNTSEAMLQDRLKLAWPDWLLKGGTWLGPRIKS